MPADPLRRVPTAWRLWGAAALCVTPLGLVWSTTITPGTTLFGDCGSSDGPYCVPDTYLPGSASFTRVSESPARIFLFFAIVAFAVIGIRVRTTLTRRVARAATVSVFIAAVLAADAGSGTTLVCCVLALALTVPVVWGPVVGQILAPGAAAR